MRIISRKTLRDFWEEHADAEQPLKAWFHETKSADWKSFADIKARHRSADILPGNRVIFNLKGHTYRLIVCIHFNTRIVSSASSVLTPNTTGSMQPRFKPNPMKPKVLKTVRDHRAALAHIAQLMAQSATDESELELWSLLVEKYEEAQFPISAPDPIEAIRFRMDQAGLQPADLQPYLQSKSKVSEVMNRKRPLSLSMIRALHQGLQIPAEVLVQEPASQYGARQPIPSRRNKKT